MRVLLTDDPPAPSPRQVAARRRYRRSLIVCGALALVLLIAAAVLPVPYVIVSPGPVFNTIGEYDGKPVIKITGTTTYPTTGELNMTTVRERGGPYGPLTAIEAVVAYFNPTWWCCRKICCSHPDSPTPIRRRRALRTSRSRSPRRSPRP